MKFTIALLVTAAIAGIVRIASGDPSSNGLVVVILGAGFWGLYRVLVEMDARRAR